MPQHDHDSSEVDPHDLGAPPPSVVPDGDAREFELPTDGGSWPLTVAAAAGRANPGEWVFVEFSTNQAARRAWVKAVRLGRRKMLGGRDEQWNASTVPGVVRDGEFIPLDRAGPVQESEQILLAKYVAFVGRREAPTVAPRPVDIAPRAVDGTIDRADEGGPSW